MVVAVAILVLFFLAALLIYAYFNMTNSGRMQNADETLSMAFTDRDVQGVQEEIQSVHQEILERKEAQMK